MGTIKKREGVRGVTYQARVRLGRRVAAKTFRRKHDADAWITQMENDKNRGVAMDPAGSRTKFERLAEQWLRSNPAKRETTLARDMADLKTHICPALKDRSIDSIRPAEVQDLVNLWTTKMSPNSVRRTFGTLRAVFNYAVGFEMLGRSPCRKIRLPKGAVREPHAATQEQLAALAEAMDPRYALIVWVAALTGMRWGEVAGLRVGNLDLARQVVHIKEIRTRNRKGAAMFGPPKSKASIRTIALPDGLVDALAQHLDKHGLRLALPRALVFSSPEGQPLNYSNFRSHVWAPATQAAGLPDFRFHDLRRTNATFLVHAGVDVKTAQARLGHSDPRLTIGLYAQATTAADRAAADALDQIAGPITRQPRVKRAHDCL